MNNKFFNDYKSPVRKWVKFFQESRNKWKARSLEKQKRIDFLETKVKDLRNSREHWKQKAKKQSNAQSENNLSTSSKLRTKDENVVIDKNSMLKFSKKNNDRDCILERIRSDLYLAHEN